MKRYIKNILLFLYSGYLWVCLSFRLKYASNTSPVIFYGGFNPSELDRISGGKVKLLSLVRKFGPESTKANVFYIVTSALPKGVETMIRVAKKKGLKVIVNQNGVGYPAWVQEPELSRLNKRNLNVLKQADFIVYQSRFCESAANKWVGRVNAPSSIVYNPVSVERLRVHTKTPSKNCRLLILGSHRHAERVMVALEAVKVLKDQGVPVHLFLAGILAWDHCEQQVAQFLKSKGLETNVTRLGPYLQKDLVQILSNADVLIHLQDKDASPTVPLEAMSAGIPVIAPKSGGLPELITPEVGSLLSVEETWERFNLPSAQQIAAEVKKLWPVSETVSQYCVQRAADNFDEKIWLDQHEKIFKGILQ